LSDFVEKVRAAGVIGAGGAGFPTHVKYQSKVEIIIANGAECEPLLHCDQEIMAREAAQVVEGLEAARKAAGARRGLIALKKKYHAAIAALSEEIRKRPHLEIFEMDSYYPAGDEQNIVYEATGRIVPEGGIPLQVGAVVNNVGTLANISRAMENIPVTERILTVAGAVRRPATFSLPVGTSVGEAIELAGGASTSEYRVILGGPMMGVIISDTSIPVTKTLSGIIVLPADHHLVMKKSQSSKFVSRRAQSACDQCFECTELCPRFLLGHEMRPHVIMRVTPYGLLSSAVASTAFLCCECGLCGLYACDTDLSPNLINASLKADLWKAGEKNPHRRSDLKVHEFRETRKVPTSRLVQRLGLKAYDVGAPWEDVDFKPARVVIPLKQGAGSAAIPVVKEGKKVRRGDLIGEIPEGKLGARMHASISGIVRKVGESIVIERG